MPNQTEMRDGAVYFGEERGPSGSGSWTVAYPTGNNLRALSQITQKTYISGNLAKSVKRKIPDEKFQMFINI